MFQSLCNRATSVDFLTQSSFSLYQRPLSSIPECSLPARVLTWYGEHCLGDPGPVDLRVRGTQLHQALLQRGHLRVQALVQEATLSHLFYQLKPPAWKLQLFFLLQKKPNWKLLKSGYLDNTWRSSFHNELYKTPSASHTRSSWTTIAYGT